MWCEVTIQLYTGAGNNTNWKALALCYDYLHSEDFWCGLFVSITLNNIVRNLETISIKSGGSVVLANGYDMLDRVQVIGQSMDFSRIFADVVRCSAQQCHTS